VAHVPLLQKKPRLSVATLREEAGLEGGDDDESAAAWSERTAVDTIAAAKHGGMARSMMKRQIVAARDGHAV